MKIGRALLNVSRHRGSLAQVLGYFKVRAIVMTDAMFEEAVQKASRMGSKPDHDVLHEDQTGDPPWLLTAA